MNFIHKCSFSSMAMASKKMRAGESIFFIKVVLFKEKAVRQHHLLACGNGNGADDLTGCSETDMKSGDGRVIIITS